jgi:2-(1,2-epoxy-1,2-dihydrophenyl)acetyl-CoA isomerase
VAPIMLDRPSTLNAFAHETLTQLRRAVDLAVEDPAVVGIVITGAGRGFCSGLDSSELTASVDLGSAGRIDPGDDLPGFLSWLIDIENP